MSSFKRKGTVKQPQPYPGVRSSPANPSTSITSTGIPSLDDILGGGLPLSCSLLVIAPDLHSSYGDLVQKYFIAQGLQCQHRLCVVDDNAEEFVKGIMWLPRGLSGTIIDDEKAEIKDDDEKIKIAWRYEKMSTFRTTVSAPSSSSTDNFCHNFDLTSHVPSSIVDSALSSAKLTCIDTPLLSSGRISVLEVLSRIKDILDTGASEEQPTPSPLRICVPTLGSPQWGELTPQDVLYFLHSLRATLRHHPHVCASLSLAPHLCVETWGGSGWHQKLGWVTDAAFTLSAFSADPSLMATFPDHHGLLHIHKLPAIHTLVPPSDKFSTLRGLFSSGENNLTFKSTRKRLIFETLHLDIEGGVGERRTTPATTSLDSPASPHHHEGVVLQDPSSSKSVFATIEVSLEDLVVQKPDRRGADAEDKATEGLEPILKKQKKKVGFRADRPDLYDF